MDVKTIHTAGTACPSKGKGNGEIRKKKLRVEKGMLLFPFALFAVAPS